MLTQYNLKMPHAVFSGEEALSNIPHILSENGVRRLAVFTDRGIEGAGLLEIPMEKVRKAGVACTVLDNLPAEPTYEEAQKLVDQILADARQMGYEAVLLDTFPFLESAIRLYQRHGFYQVPSYNGTPMEELIYLRLDLK